MCIGCSSTITTGSVNKLIQNIRYLDVDYTSQTRRVLIRLNINKFLNPPVPEQINNQLTTADAPSEFSVYGVYPSFISNYWGVILISIISFGVWLLCHGLIYCFTSCDNVSIRLVKTLLTYLSRAALNVFMVQLYGGFADTVLYLVLEMKTYRLKSTWSDISFGSSLLFTVLGLCLLSLHCMFLIHYHRLKSERSSEQTQLIQSFLQKYHWLDMLYKDFADTWRVKHGFLLFLILRHTVISIITTCLSSVPLLQAILFVFCSLIICEYLLCNKPFHNRCDYIMHTFCEICVLVVYTCVLATASLDFSKHPAPIHRQRLGFVVVVLNLIIKIVSIAHMCIRTALEAWTAYKSYIEEKRKKRRVITLHQTSRSLALSQDQSNAAYDMERSALDHSTNQPQNSSMLTSNSLCAPTRQQTSHLQEASLVDDQISTFIPQNRSQNRLREHQLLNILKPRLLSQTHVTETMPSEDISSIQGQQEVITQPESGQLVDDLPHVQEVDINSSPDEILDSTNQYPPPEDPNSGSPKEKREKKHKRKKDVSTAQNVQFSSSQIQGLNNTHPTSDFDPFDVPKSHEYWVAEMDAQRIKDKTTSERSEIANNVRGFETSTMQKIKASQRKLFES